MPTPFTSRRDFLRSSALAAAGAVLVPSLARAQEAKRNIPIAVQLYSVRNELKADYDGTIEQIGKMGYQGVEFASRQEWEKKPAELRKLLDDNGLKCMGTHTALITLQGDALKRTVELHKTLGNRFLIVPSLRADTAEAWQNLAKQFNDIAAKLKEQDMLTGFHAHAGEFKKYGDKTAWEIFFENTNADVIHQVDVGNTLNGGGDPIAMIKKYAGRTKSLHMKEHGGAPGAAIGEGKVEWKALIEACQTVGGTEWYIVEHETGKTPLVSIKTCLDNLKKMTAA
jgi:sugar phosphate isomerase/epimerase